MERFNTVGIITENDNLLIKVDNTMVYYTNMNGDFLKETDLREWDWLASVVGNTNVRPIGHTEVVDVSTQITWVEDETSGYEHWEDAMFAGKQYCKYVDDRFEDMFPVYRVENNVILVLGWSSYPPYDRVRASKSEDILVKNRGRNLPRRIRRVKFGK